MKEIKVKQIVFNWSEASQIEKGTTVNTFAEANSLIRQVAYELTENEGYRKTDFTIFWEDGRKHEGRIDITHSHEYKANPLGQHVQYFYENLAGLKKPTNYTWEQHKNFLKSVYKIGEKEQQEIRQILETYALRDIKQSELVAI